MLAGDADRRLSSFRVTFYVSERLGRRTRSKECQRRPGWRRSAEARTATRRRGIAPMTRFQSPLITLACRGGHLLLGGCAIGPDYKRPPVAEPESLRAGHGGGRLPRRCALVGNLQDPVLRDLIHEALAQQLRRTDRRAACARRGRAFATRSDLFPSLNYDASGGKEQRDPRPARQARTPGADHQQLLLRHARHVVGARHLGRIRRATRGGPREPPGHRRRPRAACG